MDYINVMIEYIAGENAKVMQCEFDRSREALHVENEIKFNPSISDIRR
jgi:hypothetical protein